jgi:transposase
LLAFEDRLSLRRLDMQRRQYSGSRKCPLGVDSAQQIIAELAQAAIFCSAAALTSWVGTCRGKEESAEQGHSSRSAKGNKYLRRVLNQAAHAAVAKKGCHFQVVFRRLLPTPRLSVCHGPLPIGSVA